MAKTVLFIHSAGTQGGKQGSSGFLAILEKALGPGYSIRHPDMPKPEKPEYKDWKVLIGKELSKLETGSILIGHSLGGSVLLKYLAEEQCARTFSALFMVAAPYWGLPRWNRDDFILERGFSRKVTQVRKIFIFHAKDDKVVSHEHIERYGKTIPHATLREVTGQGHGFDSGECPALLADIRSLG